MAPKKALVCLGSVQPIAERWRAEVSEVGKGPSRLTKAHAEQDLEVARGAESRTDMGARLRQLVESGCCVSVDCSADDSRDDLPCAKGASPSCLAGHDAYLQWRANGGTTLLTAEEIKSKRPRVEVPLTPEEQWIKLFTEGTEVGDDAGPYYHQQRAIVWPRNAKEQRDFQRIAFCYNTDLP